VETRDGDGRTVLLIACRRMKVGLVKFLLEDCNADIDAVDKKGRSCLHWAAYDYDNFDLNGVEVARYLLDNYPEAHLVAKRDNRGRTALYELLGDDDADEECLLEMVRLMVNYGAPVDTRNHYGETFLHKLARFYDSTYLEAVREFIQCGAEPRAVDEDGATPFDVAVAKGNNKLADYLLTCFDLLAVDDDGNTFFDRNRALEYYYEGSSHHILLYYTEQLVERQGDRAIHSILEAAEYSYVFTDGESVEQQQPTLQVQLPIGRLDFDHFQHYLKEFFDRTLMHKQDITGATPFHFACRDAVPVEILSFLLDLFPEALKIADYSGCLPLHCACQAAAPSHAVLQFLLQRDPEATTHILARNNKGELPLHLLAGANPPDNALALLLEAEKGSIKVATNSGDLPLMVAFKARASLSVAYRLLRAYPDTLENMGTVGELEPRTGVPSFTDLVTYTKKLEQKRKLEVTELKRKAELRLKRAKSKHAEEAERLEQKAAGYRRQRDEALEEINRLQSLLNGRLEPRDYFASSQSCTPNC